MSYKSILSILATFLLLFVLVGCGDDDADTEGTPDTGHIEADTGGDETDTGGDETDTGGGEAGTVDVVLSNFAFAPASIEITAGTTVRWTNEDSAGHTVTSGEPGAATDLFNLSVDANGGTAEYTFDEAGTFAYFCTPHPNMLGTVIVTAAE